MDWTTLVKGLRTQADTSRLLADAIEAWASQPAAGDAPSLLTPEEAIKLLGGQVTRQKLCRLTKGQPFRRDFSRTDIRFEKQGFVAWLESGGNRRRPRRPTLRAVR